MYKKQKRFIFILLIFVMCNGFTQSADDFVVGAAERESGVVLKKYIGTETDIQIPSVIQGFPVQEIGSGCFRNTNIKSVIIPESIKRVYDHAFADCKSLTDVKFLGNDNIFFMSDRNQMANTFRGCDVLKNVTLPKGQTLIKNGMFANCTALENITIPEDVVGVLSEAFMGSGLTAVILPSKIESIPLNTFSNCKSLTTVVLPAGIKSMYNSFQNCPVLAKVTIPGSVKRIDFRGDPFLNCPNINLADQIALRQAGYNGKF